MENISGILATYNFSNLEDRIEFELDGVIEKEIALAYCPENFELCITCMDYTTLKVTDTDRSVKGLITKNLLLLQKNNLSRFSRQKQWHACCSYYLQRAYSAPYRKHVPKVQNKGGTKWRRNQETPQAYLKISSTAMPPATR